MKLSLFALLLGATAVFGAAETTTTNLGGPRDLLPNADKTAPRGTVNAVDRMVIEAPAALRAAASATSADSRKTVGIDKIVPTPEQLGDAWSSNRVVAWVDPLSSPTVMTNGDHAADWLQIARGQIGKGGREASAFVRLFHQGTNLVHIHITRFQSKDDITPNWGRDNETWTKPDLLPSVGEEVRFYHRHDIHDNIVFRRGRYVIDVEGVTAPFETLKQVATVLDGNLVKRQPALLAMDEAHNVGNRTNDHPARYRVDPAPVIVLDITDYASDTNAASASGITRDQFELRRQSPSITPQYYFTCTPGQTRCEFSKDTLQPRNSPPFDSFKSGERWHVLFGPATNGFLKMARWTGVIEFRSTTIAGQASDPVSFGDWSPATNGLRARLALGEDARRSDTRVGVLYLELQNTLYNPLYVPYDLLKPPVKFELRDPAGKALEASASGYDGYVPPATWLVLPLDSVLRFRLNVDAAGVPREPGFFVPGGGSRYWVIPRNASGEYLLSGILSAKKDSGWHPVGLNTNPYQPDRPYIWEGTLQLPPVRISAGKQ